MHTLQGLGHLGLGAVHLCPVALHQAAVVLRPGAVVVRIAQVVVRQVAAGCEQVLVAGGFRLRHLDNLGDVAIAELAGELYDAGAVIIAEAEDEQLLDSLAAGAAHEYLQLHIVGAGAHQALVLGHLRHLLLVIAETLGRGAAVGVEHEDAGEPGEHLAEVPGVGLEGAAARGCFQHRLGDVGARDFGVLGVLVEAVEDRHRLCSGHAAGAAGRPGLRQVAAKQDGGEEKQGDKAFHGGGRLLGRLGAEDRLRRELLRSRKSAGPPSARRLHLV